MARANTIKAIRSTRANLNSQAGANNLLQGEPYLITDENRLAIGLSVSTYQDLFKAGETLAVSQLPAFTGDATSAAGSSTLTLASVNGNTGNFGSTTVTPVLTVDGKGRVTAVSTATITPVNVTDGVKGDITVSGGSWGITSNSIQNSDQVQIASGIIKGRATTGTGNIEDLTAAQVTALLTQFGTTAQGVVPGSGGGVTNFLRADGSWAAPTAVAAALSNLTMNNSGSGAASGATYNGAAAVTLSYNTLGAAGLTAANTFTAKQTFLASTTSLASITIPSGVAPTAPVSGDTWNDGNGLNFRASAATVQLGGNWTDLGANTLYATTSPTAPTQGVRIYGVKRANRHMIGYIDPTGRTERAQVFLGSNTVALFGATFQTGTTVAYTTINMPVMTAVTAPTVVTMTAGTYIGMQRRVQQTQSVVGGMVELYSVPMVARNPGAASGGFHISWRFGIVALASDSKFFCGLSSATGAMTNVNPSTLFNIIGIAKDSTDTTALVLQANGGSGTAQKIALPNTGSISTVANAWFQVELFCKAGDTQFGFRVTKTTSAGVESVDEGVTTGTQNAAGGIPADATIFVPHLWGASTVATATTIQFQQFFLETD